MILLLQVFINSRRTDTAVGDEGEITEDMITLKEGIHVYIEVLMSFEVGSGIANYSAFLWSSSTSFRHQHLYIKMSGRECMWG